MIYGAIMTQLQVVLPPALERWINTRVAQGRYIDADEYVRDLVRRDERCQAASDLRSKSWSI